MGFGSTLEHIISSYMEEDLVNLAITRSFPNRSNIITVLDDLRSVIFPGFSEPELLDGRNVRFVTGEKLNRIVGLLTKEVKEALVYVSKASTCETKGALPENPILCDLFNKTCSPFELAEKAVLKLIDALPQIRRTLILDAKAILHGDPAANTLGEIVISYPGLEAILVHRIAHFLYEIGVPVIPRIMSEHIHSKTGIDIHPGAKIASEFSIDHGTGIVIGQTAIIGERVKLYQGVTLGAISVEKSMQSVKRHPTIEDDVTIYAGATILGGQTVIGYKSIIGGNTWITKSVPPCSVIVRGKTEELSGSGIELFTHGSGI